MGVVLAVEFQEDSFYSSSLKLFHRFLAGSVFHQKLVILTSFSVCALSFFFAGFKIFFTSDFQQFDGCALVWFVGAYLSWSSLGSLFTDFIIFIKFGK